MLTKGQKKFIKDNYPQMSIKKIARAIGVPASEVAGEVRSPVPGGASEDEPHGAREARRGGFLSAALTSYWSGIAIVFAVALAIRVCHLVTVSASPFFKTPILDALMYHEWALGILDGDWLGRKHPVFYMGPLYPYFLSAIYATIGKSPMGIAVVQVIISSVTAPLMYHLGRKVFGPTAGLIAGLMAAAYSMYVYFSDQILMETLVTLLNVLLLIVLVSAFERSKPWKWAAAGVLLGLSSAARGNIVLFVPLVVGALILTVGVKNRDRWLVPAVVLLAAFLIAVSPLALHNLLVGGDAVLLTSNSGVNFFIGNTLTSDGLYNKAPSYKGRMLGVSVREQTAIFPEIARGELKREDLKPSEVSRFWRGKTLEEIRSNPGGWLRLVMSKLKYYFNAYEVPNNRNYYFDQQFSPVLSWPLLTFGILIPFGVLGMVVSWRRWGLAAPLYAFFAAQVIAVVPFFVVDRYRLAVVPVIIVFAAAGLLWLRQELVAERWSRAGITAVLLAAGYALAYQPVRKIDYLGNYFNLGNVQWTLGNTDEALKNYDLALAMTDRWQKLYYQKGRLLMQLGRRDEAIPTLQAALSLATRAKDTTSIGEVQTLLRRLGVDPTVPPAEPPGGNLPPRPSPPRLPDIGR